MTSPVTSPARRAAAAAILALLLIFPAVAATSSEVPLLDPEAAAALAAEISGASARRTVQELTLHHRMRGSRGYRAAAEAILQRAKEWGLQEVEMIRLPADGEIVYGTQRSRPAWNAEFAELWEMSEGRPARKIADYDARPVTLAQDSVSGEAFATLVDVGAGTSEADYAGKEIGRRLVLTSSQPGTVADLAVGRYGAVGIVSYAQNQKTAWWKEDDTLVRWGHLETFTEHPTFAFMVSLRQARAWQERLSAGENVWLKAKVKAGQEPGAYLIPSAAIPGADPELKSREIAFSCHLDHLRPGANDNASGCAAILEAGRALASLVKSGRIPPPRRTLRFYWPAEIEGTIALLNARPEVPDRTDAVVHLDMVGGDPAVTKAIFHVTKSPRSLPTFVNDVAEAIGRFVNRQTSAFAGGEDVAFPLVDPEGGKEALLAEMADYSMGSDHDVWAEGSFRVPAIYLNDWPDRYIHTHKDGVENIDPTKLKRAAFIGAASAYYLSRLTEEEVPELMNVIDRHALERRARAMERALRLGDGDMVSPTESLTLHGMWEDEVTRSIERFATLPPGSEASHRNLLYALQRARPGRRAFVDSIGGGPQPGNPGATVYTRSSEPRGPMHGFGYSYLDDRRAALGLDRPKLLDHQGLWGGGSEYAYEALNLVNGQRSVAYIHANLEATYGPVPLEMVQEYLELLEAIGVLSPQPAP